MQNVLEIYCDGACQGNPGPGGWGAVLIWGDKIKEISGHDPSTTNNKMELTAAIKALEAVTKPTNIIIFTDSQYVKNGITVWIKSWKKNGWRSGKIKNQELWQRLDELNQKYQVEWRWVKGHSGDKYNEMADRLATAAISIMRGNA